MAKTTMVMLTVVVMMLTNGITAKRLVVGDDNGWNVPPSLDFYDTWSAKQNFTVGDILVFNFTADVHTVAIVTSRDAYDQCDATIDMNPEIFTQLLEGTLASSGLFYFFCTIGSHCANGMKFAANVSATPAEGPIPASASSPESL